MRLLSIADRLLNIGDVFYSPVSPMYAHKGCVLLHTERRYVGDMSHYEVSLMSYR